MSIVILGGGTFSDVAPHLSLCARAFGSTAIEIYSTLIKYRRDVNLVLTKMADVRSKLVSNADVSEYVDTVLADPNVKVIIFSAAMCDFSGYIDGVSKDIRLSSKEHYDLTLVPDTFKVLSKIKKARPDIFLVGFKTTSYETEEVQIEKSRKQIAESGCNVVFANDIGNRNNILVYPHAVVANSRKFLLQTVAAEVIAHVMVGNLFASS